MARRPWRVARRRPPAAGPERVSVPVSATSRAVRYRSPSMPSPMKRATVSVMAATDPAKSPPATRHALASLLCDILPPQGAWSDEAYLWLTDHSRRPIELTDGRVEELPAPTDTH